MAIIGGIVAFIWIAQATSLACEGLGLAAAANAGLNLLTVALIAYVTRITHNLDREVRDGGE